jgi:hypothetical protein
VADNLAEAARHSARSVRFGRRFIRAITHCPQHEGHCDVKVDVRSRRGRRIGRVQYHLHHIRPRSRRVRRLMRRGRNPRVRVVVTIEDAADFDGRPARARASKAL